MELWTAFILGLVGSLHCAGMCGPLALALPATGHSRSSFVLSRLLYNLGRIFTYCVLGAIFGLVGQTLVLAGFQRWVSLTAGAVILIGLFASSRYTFGTPVVKSVSWVKSALGKLLQQRTPLALLSLGGLNGLLPCGLVYVACAASTASGSVFGGMEYMLAFGLGTMPMMLSIGLLGKKLQLALRFKYQQSLIRVSLCLVGTLLILRGLSLGIPYVSPDLSGVHGVCPACERLKVQALE